MHKLSFWSQLSWWQMAVINTLILKLNRIEFGYKLIRLTKKTFIIHSIFNTKSTWFKLVACLFKLNAVSFDSKVYNHCLLQVSIAVVGAQHVGRNFLDDGSVSRRQKISWAKMMTIYCQITNHIHHHPPGVID